MGSERLPGKTLMSMGQGSLLQLLLRRVKRARSLSSLVVATTEDVRDDPIAHLAACEGIESFRGSESDVLGRFAAVCEAEGADVIVRLTGDNPWLDPCLIDCLVARFLGATRPLDYLSNTLDRSFPRGFDVEVISRSALERAHLEAHRSDEREHVTLHLYRHPERFAIESYGMRFTVDTAEDLKAMQLLAEAVAEEAMEKIVANKKS